MAVFTDEVAGRNITLGSTGDWTVSSGGMPNGDNYVTGDGTIAATFYTGGNNFHVANGSAWSVEFWFYFANATSVDQCIASNTSPGVAAPLAWYIYFNSAEILQFNIYNTSIGVYMNVASTALTAATWYHAVVTKAAGADLRLYLNTILVNQDTTASGTPQSPSSSYRLNFGTDGDGSADIGASSSGLRVSKLAFYSHVLTDAEIVRHHLYMTAV